MWWRFNSWLQRWRDRNKSERERAIAAWDHWQEILAQNPPMDKKMQAMAEHMLDVKRRIDAGEFKD